MILGNNPPRSTAKQPLYHADKDMIKKLLGQKWVKTDDPIMAVFRDEELPFVNAVLKAIDQNGYVKNADVKAVMDKSAATAKRLLSKMVSAHMILLEGTGRGQRYVKWVK